jgi:transposase
VSAAPPTELLNCSTASLPAEDRDKLATAMLARDEANGRPILDRLEELAATCAQTHGLDEAQGAAYFQYSIARIAHDALAARLGGQGISSRVIDQALDFGEGRSNPAISGELSGEQLDRLIAALGASGVVTQNLTQSSWEMVGGYAAATSLMWQALARL